MNESHFFEGTEKLLEVWFCDSNDEDADLRRIEQCDLEKLLSLVRCEIISKKNDGDMDAYVLSESSMFLTKRRFILKTCGTTTLLKAIEPLIKLVKAKCGFTSVEDIFYSRKNFLQPHKQHECHQKFEDEVEHLDLLFSMGAAYCLGRLNSDCWYLYTLNNDGVNFPDQTLELLMWDLDRSCLQYFFKNVCISGAEASRKTGISNLIPGAVIDDFMFEPCGYSMNGIIPGGHYITIHVTPEEAFSYVSVETNIPKSSYDDLIHKILQIFRPNKFLLTLFANQDSVALKYASSVIGVDGYKRQEHQCSLMKNYVLNYSQYFRPDK